MSIAKGDIPQDEGRESGLAARTRAFLERPAWEYFILAMISINAIILGVETNKDLSTFTFDLLVLADHFILLIFVIEISLRILVYGRKFWTDPWSLFDFFVVAIALVPATGNWSILRAFRILRALRLITSIDSMKNVVAGLLKALPGMGSIVLLMLLICYVFSVMATMLFGEHFSEYFGTLSASAFSLFQVMTLDGWSSEIARPVIQQYPWAWAFFVIFILVTSFTVLNLFIGIIVEALQAQHAEQQEKAQDQTNADLDILLHEVRALRHDVAALQEQKAKE